jgi:glucosamine-6-phosphate deaminase
MVPYSILDKMKVGIFESRAELGDAAARDFAGIVTQAVAERGKTSVILATGNSQLPFIEALPNYPDIPWSQISVFHMDEYLGMSPQHPASFRRYIQEKIGDAFHPRVVFGIQGDTPDTEAELARYTALLDEYQPVACVLGIGENGHLAFNDPPADFHTDETIHVVTLDAVCRQQQVNEGHFPQLDAVPNQALSLTVPALLKPAHVMALVPESRKAQAVRAALLGPVTELCPASILRTQEQVRLYLDRDSSALLDGSMT